MNDLPTVVVCDTETTSAQIENAGICQVAAVALVPRASGLTIKPLYQTYCKPGAEMQPGALKVHGITPDKYSLMPSETIALWALDQIIRGFSQPVIYAGFNSSRFDYPLMERIYPQAQYSRFPHIDSMHMAIRRDNGRKYKLVNTFEDTFGHLPILDQAHDAMADCWMTAMLIKKDLDDRGTNDATILVEEYKKPVVLKLMPHGKHAGVPFAQVPISYRTWAAAKWDDMPLDLAHTFRQHGHRLAMDG